jgi:hypothetical protein
MQTISIRCHPNPLVYNQNMNLSQIVEKKLQQKERKLPDLDAMAASFDEMQKVLKGTVVSLEAFSDLLQTYLLSELADQQLTGLPFFHVPEPNSLAELAVWPSTATRCLETKDAQTFAEFACQNPAEAREMIQGMLR